MSTHKHTPNDPNQLPDDDDSSASPGKSKARMAHRHSMARHLLAGSLQSSAMPAICVALAVSLMALGAVSPGYANRFGQGTTAGELSPPGLLADLVSSESASSVAVRQDGTLLIDTTAEGREPAAGASPWVAMSQPELMSESSVDSGPVVPDRAVADGRSVDRPLVRAGLALSRTGHVSIVPPFVVLSRGSESVMLSLESGSAVVPEDRLPSWASQPRPNGRVVADFGWRGTVEVHANSVNVRHRSLDWHLPGTAI